MEWTRWRPHCKHRIKGENYQPSYAMSRIIITRILPFLWWTITVNLISTLTFAIAWCFPLSFLPLSHSVKFRPAWPCPLSCSLFLSKLPSQTPVLTLLSYYDLNSISNKHLLPVSSISSKIPWSKVISILDGFVVGKCKDERKVGGWRFPFWRVLVLLWLVNS